MVQISLIGKEDKQESGGRKDDSHRIMHKGKEDGGKQRESAKGKDEIKIYFTDKMGKF